MVKRYYPPMGRLGTAAAITLCIAFALAPLRAERPRVYAITGVRIVQAPGQTIEKGSIVIRDGLIEAVGADVRIPDDAQIIEGKAEWSVYPAFIDAAASVALKSDDQTQAPPANINEALSRLAQQGNRQTAGVPNEVSMVTPEKAIVDTLDASDNRIEKHRELGFAIAQVVPRRGIFRGYSSIVALRGGEAPDLVVRDRYAQAASFATGGFFGGGGYPNSKMGAMAAFRQALLDAHQHATWQNRYERSPTGMTRPDFHASDAALIDILNGDVPMLFVADTTLDHDRFRTVADEFELHGMVLALGCGEEIRRLKAGGMPLLLPLEFPKKPDVDGDDLGETTLEDMEEYLRAPSVPAELAGEGVEFALVTSGMRSVSDFSKNLHKAVEAGLSQEDALAALTTTPARLLGIESSVGTLTAGKSANLVVVEGDLFAEKPEWRYLFVDGRDKRYEEKEKKGDPNAQVDPRGTWEITTTVMGRTLDSTWVIQGTPGNYSGSSENERSGKRDFESVEMEGNALNLRISSPMGTQDVTVVIEGETLSGDFTIDTPRGSLTAQIKGKRVSKPEGSR